MGVDIETITPGDGIMHLLAVSDINYNYFIENGPFAEHVVLRVFIKCESANVRMSTL